MTYDTLNLYIVIFMIGVILLFLIIFGGFHYNLLIDTIVSDPVGFLEFVKKIKPITPEILSAYLNHLGELLPILTPLFAYILVIIICIYVCFGK